MSKSPKFHGKLGKGANGKLRATATLKNTVVAEAKRLFPETHITAEHLDRIKGPLKIRDERGGA